MKPLGQKAYGSIPHLIGSRLGPGDHHCHEGQVEIATRKTRDRHDLVIVQEKLDGSCCSVAKVNGKILPLGRSGYLATTSKFEQHHYFAEWVRRNEKRFYSVLNEGERIVGEWLAMAHGTRYTLPHEPFVVFDIMNGNERLLNCEINKRVNDFVRPRTIHIGKAFSIEDAMKCLNVSGHGAIDQVEGAVWRVERKERFDYLAKFVRPDKQDGIYLPEVSGKDPIWHWKP